MRVLIYSTAFPPSVGGLESMARMLAEELAARGHTVEVLTLTEDRDFVFSGYSVLRNPGWPMVLASTKAADVVLHMNLSLRALWPLLLVRRPMVISHQGMYRRADGRIGLRDRVKYWVSKYASNVACSQAVKRDVPAETTVIGNAYEDDVFTAPSGERSKDIVFVGRLVSDKGVDLLLEALDALARSGRRLSLTIVGEGPEEAALRCLCADRELDDQVTFTGKRMGHDLAALMNQHRVMAVPSRNEGFGIVALEGIACGCVLVGSDAGGLPEAIGDCGIIFRNGDVGDLARALVQALSDASVKNRSDAARAVHLASFRRGAVAERYLDVLKQAIRVAQAR